jgi:glutamate--cysteine ligase
MLPFVFEPGFGFEAYVDWALKVPMYFVYRDGRYLDASGQSFLDFMAGRLPALPGERPTLSDWADHLTTAFPDVRLKRYLEMRGADGGAWRSLCACRPLDRPPLRRHRPGRRGRAGPRLDGRGDRGPAPRRPPHRARHPVPRPPLARGRPRGRRDRHGGLARRARIDWDGRDETHYLRRMTEIAEAGVTPAEEKLALYEGAWRGTSTGCSRSMRSRGREGTYLVQVHREFSASTVRLAPGTPAEPASNARLPRSSRRMEEG